MKVQNEIKNGVKIIRKKRTIILLIFVLVVLVVLNTEKEYKIIKEIRIENGETQIINKHGPDYYYVSTEKKYDLNEPHEKICFKDIVVKHLIEEDEKNNVYKIYFHYEHEVDEEYETDGLPSYISIHIAFN